MSQSGRSLDPALVQAAVNEVRSRLHDGDPLTLDALEDAILAVFHQLGPAVAEAVAAPATEGQKKGHRRSVATDRRAGSGGDSAK